MVTIVKATKRSNVFETVYDLLTASLSVGTVTAAFIDDDHTFPQVVINPAIIDGEKLDLIGTTREYTGVIEIEVFAKKAQEIDTILDEIDADLTANVSASTDGLYFNDFEDSSADTFMINDQKIHTKGVKIKFQLNV